MVRKSQAAHGVSVVEIAARRRTASGRWSARPLNRRITANTPDALLRPGRGPPAAAHGGRPGRDARRSARSTTARNGVHPVGHLPDLRGELQRLLPRRRRRLRPPSTPALTSALRRRRRPQQLGHPRPALRRHRRRPERAQPVRLGRRDRPVRPAVHAGQAHRARPAQARGRVRPRHQGRPGRRLHGRRPGQRVRLQVRQRATAGSSLRARGRSPLDDGTLYVARFDDDGTRRRGCRSCTATARLTAANGFADQGDVLVKTRLAATRGRRHPDGPARVDRGRPRHRRGLLTLTNNTELRQGRERRQPAHAQPVGPHHPLGRGRRRPRRHHVRLGPVPARRPGPRAARDGSHDRRRGRLRLARRPLGRPGRPGLDPDRRHASRRGQRPDAGGRTRTSTDATGAPEIRRFLTGVGGCEVTGVIATPDQRTMFVNIQHPGDGGASTWPHAGRAHHAALGHRRSSPRTTAETSAATRSVVSTWPLAPGGRADTGSSTASGATVKDDHRDSHACLLR